MTLNRKLRDQYRADRLIDRILDQLRRSGRDIDRLSRNDLLGFDEFHVGGRATTSRLAELVPDLRGSTVLDIGCGLGGPVRTLVADHGCDAIGMDLSCGYIRAATVLSDLVRMSATTGFVCAAAPDLPFGDDSFDVLWMQHTGMNIEDKDRLWHEAVRVLRPHGRVALHEVFSELSGSIHYPVFWSDDPAISFIESQQATQARLGRHGFGIVEWRDITDESADWFSRVIRHCDEKGVPPLSLELVVGPSFEIKARNVHRNLVDGAVSIVQAVAELR